MVELYIKSDTNLFDTNLKILLQHFIRFDPIVLVVDRRFYGEMLVQDKVSLRLEEGAVETQKGSVSCLFRFRGSGKFRHFESVRF